MILFFFSPHFALTQYDIFHFLLFVCFTVHHENLLKIINLEDNETTKDEMMCFPKDNQDFEKKTPTINVYIAT